ncbi:MULTISPECIES: phage tail tip lysozyme [Achromobacter]|uniref:phage tail tip lysozyme n=1 Tax=Achromobacter TaxID=222 RepID=UPI001F137433|nr:MULTISPECIES: phage tail tip lysozyme [Achromobacter]
MATILDALFVELKLNAKGFKQGVAEVDRSLKHTTEESGRAARTMEANGKQAAMFFSRMRNEALALLAVFTAGMGLKNFTANTISSAAGLGQMSKNLDMSTERLQAWQRAAERAGGSAEGITAQLRQSASEVAKFRRGMSAETLPAFFQFGGKVEDLKDGNSYLLARSRIVSEIYKTDRARAALAAQMMGISDDQFDLIKQGPAAIQQLVLAQEKRSAISSKDAQDAQRLRNIYLDLRDTFESVGTKVLIALIPTFEKLLKAAQKVGDYFLENRQQIVQWIDRAVDGLSNLVEKADQAAQAVGGWKNVLIGLAALKLLSIVAPMASLATALASIGASLGVIGGASGAAGVAALGTIATVAGGVALATYSKSLNQGEGAQLDALNNPAYQSGNKAAMDAIKFFEGKGYSREQAAGIVANLMAESNLNPKAVGDNGQAVGIGQWHPVRQADFKKAFGMDLKDATLAQQLAFVDWELRNTERTAMEKLQAAKTPQQAGDAVSRYYERPKDKDGEAEKRAAAAGALYGAAHIASMEAAAGSSTAAAAQAAPVIAQAGAKPLPLNTENNHEVNINGPVTIHTQATDGQGIARDLGALGGSQSLVNQANTGTF